MAVSDRFVLLTAVLALGAWGWGRAAVAVMRRAGWENVGEAIGSPLQILLGMSLFLCVGGFMVAAGVARFDTLIGWHLVGVAFLVASFAMAVRRAQQIRLRTLLLATGCAATGAVLFLVAVANAIYHGAYLVYDDDSAYIYLAKRLVSTGGLLDPFNQRRITSYGGNTLYHAMFLHVAGNSAIRGFEFVFAALVLVLATVATAKRRWLIPGAFLLGLGVLLGHGTGPIINLSPEFSVAALSLGAYQLLRHVRPASGHDHPFLYIVIGVFMAGILALRFTFLIPVTIAFVIVVVAIRGRRLITPLAITVATVAVATAGWAVAELRSSGTPGFPVIAGNYNTSWPGGTDPSITGLGQHAHIFWGAFKYDDVGWVALASVGIGLTLLLVTQSHAIRGLVLLSAGLGCLGLLAIFAFMFSGSDAQDIARFAGPSTLACGLLAMDVLWPCRHQPDSGEVRTPATSSAMRVRGRHLDPIVTMFASTAVLVLVAAITFGYSIPSYVHATRAGVRHGYEIVERSQGFVDRYAPVRARYHHLNALVPKGAKVLGAVTYPALLGFSRYQFATLDLAGGASPPPGMPFFQGAQAKVDYLRGLGYQYIVAESSDQLGLYRTRPWLVDLRGSAYAYRAWAPYFIDWQSSVTELEQNYRFPVRYAGPLALIRIG
jgi:hypothetical protein